MYGQTDAHVCNYVAHRQRWIPPHLVVFPHLVHLLYCIPFLFPHSPTDQQQLTEGDVHSKALQVSLDSLDKSKKTYEKAFRQSCTAVENFHKADADLNLSRAEVERVSGYHNFHLMIPLTRHDRLIHNWSYLSFLMAHYNGRKYHNHPCFKMTYYKSGKYPPNAIRNSALVEW